MKKLPLWVLALALCLGALFDDELGRAQAAANNMRIELSPGTGASTSIRPAPTYVDARVLAANVSETHTIPTGAGFVLFASTCNFYAKPGASAAVPAADVTDGTGSELNPAAWVITSSMTQITLISAVACTVTMVFYN
jgi:hypothetical protein